MLPDQQLLIADAAYCRLCPRMEGSRHVLSARNGSWRAAVMFVGEAPGRRGAERTGIPFFGDVAGERFEQLLATIGCRRRDVFVTNAVLCNPRDERGRNTPPTRQEMANCAEFLQRTIDQVNPQVVIALGAIALRALAAIEDHEIDLRSGCGRLAPWYERHLGVLYHPGARSAVRCALYMAALTAKRCNATLRRFAERLERAGKPFKVVITACMRKLLVMLNQIVRDGRAWITSPATEQR